jgi:metallo-beta-lactamase class B
MYDCNMTSYANKNTGSKVCLTSPTWRNTLASMALFGVLVGIMVIGSAGSVQAQDLSDNDNPEVQRVEPFQVFDNLYYVGARWVASWLLVTNEGLIVFDALYGDLTDLVIDNIRELGFDPNDIRYLIGTHAHYDHIGGARRFQQEFGTVVMMTEEDWQMTEQPPVYREYPTPIRHLSASNGSTLNLGRTQMRFMTTPGHTPGVLSTLFTVYDDGFPHNAFMFGGVGLNFDGVERTELYIDSVERIQQLEGIEVNIPNHPSSGDVFARYEALQEREEGDPHPFIDPQGFSAWLDTLLANAQAKLEEERAAAGQ